MDCPKIPKEKGQTLVVVLVLLVIAAVVSTAVAYRAIQDIRTSAEERDSAKAAAQVDSFLEVSMDVDVWADLWTDDVQGCADYGAEEVCTVPTNFWDDYINLSDMECDDWEVKVRRYDQITSFFLGKDETVEFDLRDQDGNQRDGATELTLSWEGDAQYLILRFVKDGEIVEDIALTYGDPQSWNIPVNSNVLDLEGTGDHYVVTLNDIGNPDVVRIKALHGDASLSLSGLQDEYYQVGAIKAYCYIGDVFRESVAQVVVREYVPTVLDYALFDASGWIDKGGGM
jgi:type II secretory pathway pseudopilin PulG